MIGTLIKAARQARKLTQKKSAKLSVSTVATFQAWEAGRRNPGPKHLAKPSSPSARA